ncbi:MAG TPA: RidA family protein [Negativicutes bacterium]|nr:RidA family protein [Negativicutes bacterium]
MKTIIATNQAPQAIGPYSQAVKANGFLFLSGQIPLDPVTGQMVYGGIAMQTNQVLTNIKAVLAAEGLTLAQVVKTTVFLQSMDDFAAMNKVYGEYFPAEPPARSTVQVGRLPKDAEVEIEVVAAY